jgi:branched-chain amino acid aminotransferase
LFKLSDEIKIPPVEGKIIYEVVRIINGKILFAEDHLSRFMNSLKLSNILSPNKTEDIFSQLNLLIKKNDISTGNIKYLYCLSDNDLQFYAFFIPHQYPTDNDYQKGVTLSIYEAKRENPSH